MTAGGPYVQEWLAIGQAPGQLSISAVCNGRCLCCSDELNPFDVQRPGFRAVDDVRHQLSLMSPGYDGPIALGESLPGRISEGEAFLHPELFTILELIRRRFVSNPLHFTTNASMLHEAFIKQLAVFRPIEIAVSLHTTRPALWARIFRKSEADAAAALRAVELIRDHRLGLVGTIVPLPALCGWEDIEATYRFLVERGARSMIMYWPGTTSRTPPARLQELACPLPEFTRAVARLRRRHPVPLMAHPEMAAPLGVSVDAIVERTRHGNVRTHGGPFREVLWLTSAAGSGPSTWRATGTWDPPSMRPVLIATLFIESRGVVPSIPDWYYSGMSAPKSASNRDAVPRTIRFPRRLRRKVADDAERCGRSFESQVIAVLRHHYGEDVDIAPSPEAVLALARGSLAGLSPAEQRRLTRRLKEPGAR